MFNYNPIICQWIEKHKNGHTQVNVSINHRVVEAPLNKTEVALLFQSCMYIYLF